MTTQKTDMPIISTKHRGFVLVNNRRVHYRRWGKGPTILALHGSPQSSKAITKLGLKLANAGFCVIAPDTPGNGLSDPLPNEDKATIADFSNALLDFVKSIGLSRFAIYGFHGGAAIGCTFAARHPHCVTAFVGDGLPAWTEEERKTLLNGYLPPFSPQWDGSHMTWLWARLEEQTVFFPWHQAVQSKRMDYDVSPPESIHDNALDFLSAGDHYRSPYRAAFTFSVNDWLPNVKAPSLITAMKLDPLCSHLERPEFQHARRESFSDHENLLSEIEQHFLTYKGDSAPDIKNCALNVDGLTAGWIGSPGKALSWEGNFSKKTTTPLVLLHDAGGSKQRFSKCLSSIAKTQSVIALDLPGHGYSESETNIIFDSVATIGQEIVSACKQLGLKNYAVAGLHFGGQVAAWLVNEGHAVKGASIGVNIIDKPDRPHWKKFYAPSLNPTWDGNHLLRAFRIARWESLFFPWFERNRQHAIESLPPLDPITIHHRAIDLVRAGNNWSGAVHAEADYDLLCNLPPQNKFSIFAIEDDHRCKPEQLKNLSNEIITIRKSPKFWALQLTAFAHNI